MRKSYGGTTAEQRLPGQLQLVATEMQQLGLTTDGPGAQRRPSIPSYAVPYITVNDIWAQEGTINSSTRQRPRGQRHTQRRGQRLGHHRQQEPGLPPHRRISRTGQRGRPGDVQLQRPSPACTGHGGRLGDAAAQRGGRDGSTEPTITIKNEFDASDPRRSGNYQHSPDARA